MVMIRLPQRVLALLHVIIHSFTLVEAVIPPPAPHLPTPSERQLAWHRLEYYAFVHFGPNTFTDEEWGYSQSTPDVFAPTNLDTDQWAISFANAGMSGMILTAKHHDGMALWDTNTTTYKIGNSAWAIQRMAQGIDADVVRLAATSARKYGLKFGVYLSPWDMHRDPTIPKTHLVGTKYDEPQIFGDKSPDDYNDLYAAQLTELMTMQTDDGNPIEIFEVWLDGNSGSNMTQNFNWTRFRNIIRYNQPQAIMWGHQGVDARWVGNEDGITGLTNWHTINSTQDDPKCTPSELQLGDSNGTHWTPAEADARIRNGWFFHQNEAPMSGSDLMKMYLQSVSRSINLLLDVPPDESGQVVKEDIDSLMEFKRQRETLLNRTLPINISLATASSVRGDDNAHYGPVNLLNNDTTTYWTMDDDKTTGYFEVTLNSRLDVDTFITQEYIALGQRVRNYTIEAYLDGNYKTIFYGSSLGYKRIDRLSQAATAERVRFSITNSTAVPVIQSFQVLGPAGKSNKTTPSIMYAVSTEEAPKSLADAMRCDVHLISVCIALWAFFCA